MARLVPPAPKPYANHTTMTSDAPSKKALDVGDVVLMVGAALVIAGMAGMAAYLWSNLNAAGRLGILGLAFSLQSAAALWVRRRLPAAAEALASTGAATLFFATGMASAVYGSIFSVGVALAATGLALLVFSQFRAWSIAGHLGLLTGLLTVVGSFDAPVVPALCATALVWALRLVLVKLTSKLRSPGNSIHEEVLGVAGFVGLLAAASLGLVQLSRLGAVALLGTLACIAVLLRSRTRLTRIEEKTHMLVLWGLVLITGSSAFTWWESSTAATISPLLASTLTPALGLVLFPLVAFTAQRLDTGRLSVDLHQKMRWGMIGSAPIIVRAVFAPGSFPALLVFCAIAAFVIVLLARRHVASIALVAITAASVAASLPAAGSMSAYPRLLLLALSFTVLSRSFQRVELVWGALGVAVVAVFEILYLATPIEVWVYHYDVAGGIVALFLALAVWVTRLYPPVKFSFLTTAPAASGSSVGVERLIHMVGWYGLSAVALLVVPTATLMLQPALLDLSSSDLMRITVLVAATVLAWAALLARRSSALSASRVVTSAALAAVFLSRIGDESTALRVAVWVTLGAVCLVIAHQRKLHAVLLGTAGCWTVAFLSAMAASSLAVEAYSLPIAAIALFVAAVARRLGRSGSLAFLPGTALALLPSAFLVTEALLVGQITDTALWRLIATLTTSTVLLCVGAYRRLAALVYPAVAALLLLAASQYATVEVYVTNWGAALVAGVVLLAVGARLEYLRGGVRRGIAFARSLR